MIETATLTCGATIFVVVLAIVYLIELIDKINEGLRRKETSNEEKGTTVKGKDGHL